MHEFDHNNYLYYQDTENNLYNGFYYSVSKIVMLNKFFFYTFYSNGKIKVLIFFYMLILSYFFDNILNYHITYIFAMKVKIIQIYDPLNSKY